MKALFIDSEKQEIREVEYDQDGKTAPTLQVHIGGYIETGFAWSNGDVMFVDEEGLFKPQRFFFRLIHRADGQPLAGNGIVVGRERYRRGDYVGTDDPKQTIEELRKQVVFLTRAQADAWAKGNASEPASTITFIEDGVAKTEVIGHFGSLYADMPKPKEDTPES